MSHKILNIISSYSKGSRLAFIFSCVILLVVGLLMFDLNRLYPTYIDDWDYSFVYYTNNKLSSVFDIIPSMMKHYTMWGGRLVVHSLLQEFLLFGPFWADLFNSLMFVVYLVLIYLISNRSNRVTPLLLVIIFLLTWFFQADLGETVLWMTGSANYLWGTTILLAFLYPYYLYFTNVYYDCVDTRFKPKKNTIYSVLFFLCGVIAGWTNENMVVAIGCLLFLFLWIIWRKTKTIELWSVSGFIGFGAGAILMMIAPGNFKRYKEELGLRGIFDGKPTFDFYLDNLRSLFEGFYEYLFPLMLIYVFAATVFWFTAYSSDKKKKLIVSSLFFLATFLATFAMIASPVFKPRTWFGIITLLVTAIMVIVSNLDFSKKQVSIPLAICIIIGCVFFTQTYFEGRAELVKIRAVVDEREVEVNRQKSEGKNDIVLYITRFEKNDRLIIPKMYDFPLDPDHWMFKAYAHYHEVESVKVIEKK